MLSCWKCAATLDSPVVFEQGPSIFGWVDRQLQSVIELCASPGQHPIPANVIQQYLDTMTALGGFATTHPLFVGSLATRAKADRKYKFDLGATLNLAALNGRSILDVLHRPIEAGAPSLVDLWSGYEWLRIDFNPHWPKIDAAAEVCRGLLYSGEFSYLPPFSDILKLLFLGRREMVRAEPELCDRYAAERDQFRVHGALIHADTSYRLAMRELSPGGRFGVGRSLQARLSHFVRRNAGVSWEVAYAVVRSAREVRRLLRKRLGKALSYAPEKEETT